jgi:hypothetical protein
MRIRLSAEGMSPQSSLELLVVPDLKPKRAQVLAKHYGLKVYDCWTIRRSSSSST